MSATATISQAQAKRMVQKLIEVGDRLEAKNSRDWYEVARAAASLDALRLGLLTVELLEIPLWDSEVAA